MNAALPLGIFTCPGCGRTDAWTRVGDFCGCGWTSKQQRRKGHIRESYALRTARGRLTGKSGDVTKQRNTCASTYSVSATDGEPPERPAEIVTSSSPARAGDDTGSNRHAEASAAARDATEER